MKSQRGRVVVLVGSVLALFVILGSGFLLARRAGWIPDHVAPRRALLARSATFPHNRIDIATGELELVELLRFLGDYTGLPVIHDSTDPRITQAKLLLAAPMQDIDGELVRAFVEASGFSVEIETQASSQQVIRVAVKGKP